jgi:uncharacterized phage protein (TIGR02220 family)
MADPSLSTTGFSLGHHGLPAFLQGVNSQCRDNRLQAAVLTDIRDLPAPSTLPISEVPLSFAFLALYTGDYLRDTRHLSPLRHGVYLLLLMYCWDTRGPLPFDEQEIAGIANCRSTDEIEALRYILLRYFERMEDGYYNQRIQREIERAHAISGKRSIAGLKGFQAKAKQLLSNCQASVKQEPLPPPPSKTLDSKATTLSSSQKAANVDAIELLEFLNSKTERNFRPTSANLDLLKARIKEGYTVRDIRIVIARKCREWKGDDKMEKYLRPMTLFNRTKFAQYVGEVPPQESADVPQLPRM